MEEKDMQKYTEQDAGKTQTDAPPVPLDASRAAVLIVFFLVIGWVVTSIVKSQP